VTTRVKLRSALASAVLIAGVCVAAAAPAAADPGVDYTDYLYFSYLHDHGLSLTHPKQLKSAALGICRALDDGQSWQDVGSGLVDEGATAQEASVQIQGAATAYCPWDQKLLVPSSS
jgi:hypothetical protein